MRPTRFLLPALLLVAMAQPAMPADGKLVVEKAWARASVARNGAAYLTIRNGAGKPDRLIRLSSPVAKSAGLHAVAMADGIMRMVPLKAIEIGPGASAVLAPGGKHIMLMGLQRRLVKGQRFPLTLNFEKAGRLTVGVRVLGAGARRFKQGAGG